MFANPLFTATSGGSLVNGATGTVPASWAVQQQGAASVAVSVGANDSGPGNAVTAACTFGAVGAPGSDWVRIGRDVYPPDRWNAGDVFEAQALVQVTGTPTGLSTVRLLLQSNTTPAGSRDNMDLFAGSYGGVQWLGPDKPYKALLRTRPYRIPR